MPTTEAAPGVWIGYKSQENNCGQSEHTLKLDTVHLKVKTMEVDPDHDLNQA